MKSEMVAKTLPTVQFTYPGLLGVVGEAKVIRSRRRLIEEGVTTSGHSQQRGERFTNNSYTKHDHTKRKHLCQTENTVWYNASVLFLFKQEQHTTSTCNLQPAFFFKLFSFFLKSCLHVIKFKIHCKNKETKSNTYKKVNDELHIILHVHAHKSTAELLDKCYDGCIFIQMREVHLQHTNYHDHICIHNQHRRKVEATAIAGSGAIMSVQALPTSGRCKTEDLVRDRGHKILSLHCATFTFGTVHFLKCSD